MTPKEKAEELVKKYYRDSDLLVEDLTWIQAKECALIAVQEIINANPHSNPFTTEVYSTMLFWQEVKTEINNL